MAASGSLQQVATHIAAAETVIKNASFTSMAYHRTCGTMSFSACVEPQHPLQLAHASSLLYK